MKYGHEDDRIQIQSREKRNGFRLAICIAKYFKFLTFKMMIIIRFGRDEVSEGKLK